MTNDKLFSPLGIAVPGYAGSPRLPGEQPLDAEVRQVLSPRQPPQALSPQGAEPPRRAPLVADVPVQQVFAPPQNVPPATIAAGYGAWSARNADDITAQYLCNFPQEA
ncbi:hypothetical protein [Salinarimonas rosea]|uniref:hypothetical protein n=1 Tax=Salinarimonas rosea TaxID=552063 RepID=UPI0003F87A50|nr:hypothetical protein [Salinarimonas rosea]